LKDYVYVVETEKELQEKLNKYIQNVVPVERQDTEYDEENIQEAPFEMLALAGLYE